MDMTPPAGNSNFQVPARSSLLERRPRTLKHGDTFAMFDDHGDLAGDLNGAVGAAEGLYHKDTRFLSRLRLDIFDHRPLLLTSTVQNRNVLLTVDLTNPDIDMQRGPCLASDTLHILRSKYLWRSACYESIVARNYGGEVCPVVLRLQFDSDFRDIFEVRGERRGQRGRMTKSVLGRDRVLLSYTGLDERELTTELLFDPLPSSLSESAAEWRFDLAPDERRVLFMTAVCNGGQPKPDRFVQDLRLAHRSQLSISRRLATVRTSNEIWNELLDRSLSDIVMLTTETPYGPYPYAGIPWFSTPFGRDGIITAIEMLAFDPELARGVLNLLAATQAHEHAPERDAEPGKILHEMRQGEMAELGEVPFGRYYGSVDATPLFVLLAGMYWQRTGDLESMRQLWPSVLDALQWIDRYGDADGDGLVEYLRKSEDGLANQGWKDSNDSVFHVDGRLARGSIALCEVQAYVYAAKLYAAQLAYALGDRARGERLQSEARALQHRFEQRFWIPERGFYALALDGEKRPCKVLTSNAGHALFCGIADREHAAAVAQRLLSRDFFSRWGIRTVASGEARYNPMSYHNGSVWPHDNGLITLGLARYGHSSEALQVLTALFDAAEHIDLRRLPELFCGMRRKPGRGPTLYPVACSPQAWASAAPFALLTAVLGLELDALTNTVRFRHPRLPPSLDEVELSGLRLRDTTMNVVLQRRGASVAVNVVEKKGPAGVEVTL